MNNFRSKVLEELAKCKTMLSVARVAELLDESDDSVYRRVKRGTIPHVRFGMTIKIDPQELAAWISEHHIG